MALTDFFNYTCTVSRDSKTIIGGEEQRSNRVIYTCIPCSYKRLGRNALRNVDQSSEYDAERIEVLLEPDRINVSVRDKIVIESANFGSIGDYLVEEVKDNFDICGDVDNIYLLCKKI